MKQISVGIPDCSNAKPFRAFFEKNRLENFVLNYGSFDFLAHMLNEEMLHVCLISLSDYLKNHKDYHLFQSACISTKKASGNYILFSKYKLEKLNSKTIFVPNNNTDSKTLLKIILKEKNIEANFSTYKKAEEKADIILAASKGVIEKFEGKDYFKYDLTEMWYELTGLPFILGVWVCFKDWMEHYKDGHELAKHYLKEAVLNLKEENISYNFTQSHIETIYKFREKVISYRF